ncbi:hypothetical protein STTU_4607 [Streptomyces sp. Tu6071]|nr:hypothetical protein STTU_4607 [Streptomyces sp. Tu6071]
MTCGRDGGDVRTGRRVTCGQDAGRRAEGARERPVGGARGEVGRVRRTRGSGRGVRRAPANRYDAARAVRRKPSPDVMRA